MVERSHNPAPGTVLSPDEIQLVLSLRLLIARVANRDSLAWWDDDAFTPSARFVLDRLFPTSPPLAARSLALRAAWTRHRAAVDGHAAALHLYHLDADNADGQALRFKPLLSVPVPETPIPTLELLRERLLALLGRPQPYTVARRLPAGVMELELPPRPANVPVLLHRARTFAWAYLEGEPGRAVFPFCLDGGSAGS